MRLRRIRQGLLILALGLLGFGVGAIAPPPAALETGGNLTPSLPDEQPQSQYPFEPLVELTVCPEGPPTCQFKRIQDAIDAAPDTGPIELGESWDKAVPKPKIPLIHIAPGTYVENLVIFKNVWLQGEGKELVTLRGSQEGPAATRPTIFIAGSNSLGIGIEGLTIEGGLQIVGWVNGYIANNIFKGDALDTGDIVLMGTLAKLAIVANSFIGGKRGIYLKGVLVAPGSFSSLMTSVVIYRNTIYGAEEDGIEMFYSGGVEIISNRIYKNGKIGIQIWHSSGITISNNILEENAGAIYSHTCDEVEIVMNRIEGHKGDAVFLLSGDYTIEENQILNNGGMGLDVFGLARYRRIVRIVENTIAHNKTYGLNLLGDLEIIKECRDNQIFDNGTDYSSEELRKKCKGNR